MAVSFGTARNPGGDGHGGGHGHGHRPHDGTFIEHPTVKLYVQTYVLLLILLVITVALYGIDLSRWIPWHGINLLVAMVVAVTKAYLVLRNFMNVKGSTRLIWLWAALGFIWLLLMGGVFLDYQTRVNPLGWQPERPSLIQTGPRSPEAPATNPAAGVATPGDVPAGVQEPAPEQTPATSHP